jgi:uncharacterized protein (DUF1810 family)
MARPSDLGDPFNLDRFIQAQAQAYAGALRELESGRKQGHWIWFVFPQIAGLGSSSMNRLYAIASVAEARAYLDHPVLGPRLRTCVDTVNAHAGRSARAIFGHDDIKFRSSLTLFAQAAPDEPRFALALANFFGGEPDPATLQKMGTHGRGS